MTFIEEIARLLQTAGVGTLGTDLYYSYAPADKESLVAVIDTGGVPPDIDLPTKEPTFQVFIRATSYDAGKAKLDAVRSALHQKRSGTLAGGTYYYYIYAIAEGGHIGLDEAGHDEFSINFKALLR